MNSYVEYAELGSKQRFNQQYNPDIPFASVEYDGYDNEIIEITDMEKGLYVERTLYSPTPSSSSSISRESTGQEQPQQSPLPFQGLSDSVCTRFENMSSPSPDTATEFDESETQSPCTERRKATPYYDPQSRCQIRKRPTVGGLRPMRS